MPPSKITDAKRICAHWRTTILSSKMVELARVLKPIATIPEQKRYVVADMPDYGACHININPDLNYWFCNGPRAYYGLAMSTDHSQLFDYRNGVEKMRGHLVRRPHASPLLLDEFVTKPRCSAIAVTIFEGHWKPDPPLSRHCIVYVPNGVKFGDLLHVVSKLVSERPLLLGSGKRHGIDVGFWAHLAWYDSTVEQGG